MTLYVKELFEAENDLETVVISHDMLRASATHLFITSHKWDKAIINVTDGIPEGSLRYLHTVADDISVHIPNEMTDKVMHTLVDLYPDKAGAIRRCYMTKQSLEGVLNLC